ncbi:serine hydrolase domain-containing protein [Bhargavaea ullalensis]|uniref:CubicO group peptidase (Beta-lactamase class C family) n=1 Tax=Bhargavaea ullalensis TaxID=1265685 RepID=A0ABV2GBG1_9BACL
MYKEIINQYCEAMKANGHFSGALAVRHKGEVLLSRGYGMADRGFGISNTDKTKFRIGSLSKPFTAMAVLQLEERGRLALEDPVNRFIDGIPGGERITIHHLLCHMSGLADFASQPDYWMTTMRLPATLEETVGRIKALPPEFAPGSAVEYTNSGYAVLAAIIEKASGLEFADFLQRNILGPLGMEHTGNDDGRKLIPDYAAGYTVDRDIRRAEFIDMSVAAGAYGMYSSVSDLLLWDRALGDNSIIGPRGREKMFTLHNEMCGYDWFYSKEIRNRKERVKWEHFGDVNGFVSHYLRVPEEELSVVVLSNFNLTPADRIARDLAAIVLDGEQPDVEEAQEIRLDEDLLAGLAGRYRNEQGELNLFSEGNRLFAALPKMYGVVYNCEIIGTEEVGGKVSLRGKQADDRFTVRMEEETLIHRDPWGRETTYRKE